MLTKISWSANYRLSEWLLSNDPSKTKITKLDLRKLVLWRQKHILRFQITMYDILRVKVVQSCQYLYHDSNIVLHVRHKAEKQRECHYLKYKKFCFALSQSTFWTVQYHLQHVSLHLLHDNINLQYTYKHTGTYHKIWLINVKTFSVVSNICSKVTIPGWLRH